MDVSSIALQGLEEASAQLDAAANGIVQAGASSANGAGVDTVDLSSDNLSSDNLSADGLSSDNLSADMVAMMTAQNQFEANIGTMKTADEMQQSLINVAA